MRDVIKLIEDDGRVVVRHRGSNRHFQHPTKQGTVTVPGHPRDEMASKTLASVWRQARLKGGRL